MWSAAVIGLVLHRAHTALFPSTRRVALLTVDLVLSKVLAMLSS